MSSTRETYVITLQLDAASFEWLQELRTRHFPPRLNFLPAHLTLLHVASLDQVDRLKLGRVQFERLSAAPLRFTGLRSLGGGTAVVVHSPSLEAVRVEMMQTMRGSFSRQDQQPFKAHVTVQNKVDHETASRLLRELSGKFVPRDGSGRGLMIWRYLGGSWALQSVIPFA